ncbi:MAG: phosphatase PAP2 family protein [Ignavibacteriae bacterium]|nr:phosphatase PAP2 family protein [Ignavibacteriota bacterium]
MTSRKLFAPLNSADIVTISFLAFLTLLNLIFHAYVAEWYLLVPANALFIGLIVLLAHSAEQHRTKLLMQIHRWYLYAAVLLTFKELYFMVRPIHPIDYDALLISIDKWIFGVNPTEWLAQFTSPVLTEILQLGYSSYYLLFIILGIDVIRKHSWQGYDNAAFMIVYGFYLSYLGYFLLPAVGPRFTLHSFEMLNQELPGVLLTELLRAFVNWGESIPSHLPNPVDFVQRDVFPSGHTQLSLVVVFCAFHYKIATRWLLAILTALLIIGTVYLRYHYVVDVIGGAIFFVLTIWSGWKIIGWWERVRRETSA